MDILYALVALLLIFLPIIAVVAIAVFVIKQEKADRRRVSQSFTSSVSVSSDDDGQVTITVNQCSEP